MSRRGRRAALVALLAASVLLGGCVDRLRNIFATGSDNVDPPTELVELTSALPAARLWSAKVGEGAARQGARLAPAVAAGRVHVASLEGQLSAHDSASGKLLWRVDTGLRLGGGPAATADLVVVGGLDGQLLAFDGAGEPKWQATLSSEIIAAPAIGHGLVVAQSNDGRSFAFEQDSGTLRWIVDRAVPTLSLRGTATPIITDGMTFIGQANGRVSAVENSRGEVQWEHAVGLPEGRTDLERMIDVDSRMLLVQGDLFVAGYGSQAVALASESGRVLWTREFSSYTGFAVSGSNLLATHANGELYSLATRSGSPQWRHDGLKFRALTTPVIQGDFVAVGDFEGYLHWLRLDNGEVAARVRVGKKGIRSAPVVVDGVLYALDLDGTLAAFATPGG